MGFNLCKIDAVPFSLAHTRFYKWVGSIVCSTNIIMINVAAAGMCTKSGRFPWRQSSRRQQFALHIANRKWIISISVCALSELEERRNEKLWMTWNANQPAKLWSRNNVPLMLKLHKLEAISNHLLLHFVFQAFKPRLSFLIIRLYSLIFDHSVFW